MIDVALVKKIALVVFFAVFVVILLRLIFSGRRKYERAARLPLEGETLPHIEPDGRREKEDEKDG